MKNRKLLTLSLVAALLLVPLAASADSHDQSMPITWLSFVKAQTGKGGALGQHIAKGGAKIYDPMMADGHVLSWGVGQPINHLPGDDWTHVEWVTFSGWAAVDAFMGAFMAMQMAKSPEEMMADQEEWYSLVEPGSHYDQIVRHVFFQPVADAGRPAYISLGMYHAQAGQDSAVMEFYEEYAKPVMAQLQADGQIMSYGMYVEDIHAGSGWTHVGWHTMPSLSARQAMIDAFDAAAAARGEDGQKAFMSKAMATFKPGHQDRILVITHLGGSGGPEKPGGSEE